MNISQDRALQLEDRMMNFSLGVINLVRIAKPSQENKVIANQLLRSATSIGANYAEANNAASKQDFRNKIFIAKKEAAETRYWLRLLDKANGDLSISTLLQEVSELLMILQKIISSLKNAK